MMLTAFFMSGHARQVQWVGIVDAFSVRLDGVGMGTVPNGRTDGKWGGASSLQFVHNDTIHALCVEKGGAPPIPTCAHVCRIVSVANGVQVDAFVSQFFGDDVVGRIQNKVESSVAWCKARSRQWY